MNSCLRSKGLDIRQKFFNQSEIDKAIEACLKFYKDLGMDHVVAAIIEFRDNIYKNPLCRNRVH